MAVDAESANGKIESNGFKRRILAHPEVF